jgi:hypothetical protein
MTMINSYGIGAGRAIAEQYEDTAGKEKKEVRRRLTAAQIAEQERLKARLQQRSTEYLSPDVLKQNSETLPNALRALRRPQTTRTQQSEALPDEEMIAESDQMTSALQPANRQASVLESSFIEADRRYEGLMPDPARGERLIGSLLQEFVRSPAKLTRERALSNLMSMSDSLRSRRAAGMSQQENEGVISYLEFLEGYFDSGSKPTAHSDKIAALMSEIRIQLSLVADPGRAGIVQHAAMTNQIRQPADVVPAVSARESRKLSKRGRVGVDDEESMDGRSERQAESAILFTPTGTPTAGSASQSSMSKDSNRRRDETLVSVTLRSV